MSPETKQSYSGSRGPSKVSYGDEFCDRLSVTGCNTFDHRRVLVRVHVCTVLYQYSTSTKLVRISHRPLRGTFSPEPRLVDTSRGAMISATQLRSYSTSTQIEFVGIDHVQPYQDDGASGETFCCPVTSLLHLLMNLLHPHCMPHPSRGC